MKIIIVAVNYNTYSELNSFLNSVEESVRACEDKVVVDVVIADNSTKKECFNTDSFTNLIIKVVPLNNLGYMGGAQHIINSTEDLLSYDYVAISNVDLKLNIDFISTLNAFKINDNVGWIAPSIYSLQEKRDKKTLYRPSAKKFRILCTIFRYPILFNIYRSTLYLRKRKSVDLTKSKEIYSGHGAFILLTKGFFRRVHSLDFKPFLFCEENYIAELLRENGLKCIYEPTLKIWDSEHVSTGKIDYKRICKLNYEAHLFIFKRFYR